MYSMQLCCLSHFISLFAFSGAPYFTLYPQSVNVTEGDTATIECQGSGIPGPTVTWQMNHTPLRGKLHVSWWRHQMETFSALLDICAGNSPVPGELPAQRPVTRSFDHFSDLRLNERLRKQAWGWWFDTLPRPLWRQSNVRFKTSLSSF